MMKIYVDIDDVLARTIESLIDLLDETHGRRVDVEAVRHFDLEKSFDLSDDEIFAFMERAHTDDALERIEPVAEGIRTLEDWRGDGHEVHLVTGRPPAANAASRRWLERHAVPHVALHHLDKWSRPTWNEAGLPALAFDELGAMAFDFAVEDSLDTAVRLVEEFALPVALMDRPWNRDLSGVAPATRARLTRCVGWAPVAGMMAALR
ncbi:MAG: hypothetical protein AAGC67_06590 [Myxococcota bacterium]